jgi:hypothetical protein
MLTLTDSTGNAWTVTALAFDARGRAVFELRDFRGLPAPRAPLSIITLMNAKRTRRWLRYYSGVDVIFDTVQHVADLSVLARQLNAEAES